MEGTMLARTQCGVCGHPELREFQWVDERCYRRCPQCSATLMDPAGWLSEQAERAVYALHDNRPDDPRYRSFLHRLAGPLLEVLPPGQKGLDFGCGPGPALAQMLEEAGHQMALYDPAFFPDTSVLAEQWDFIVCTEVVEHLRHPLAVFRQLDQMIRPGGWLGIMTCFQTDDERFANWFYRRDPTHIVFYREATFSWLAKRFHWQMTVPRKDVVLLHKML